MPALLIAYTIPRAFQLIYSPKGEGRRPEGENEDREGKDADGGVAAALSRRGKVWAGRTDSTTECGWEGGAISSIRRLRESRRFHPK